MRSTGAPPPPGAGAEALGLWLASALVSADGERLALLAMTDSRRRLTRVLPLLGQLVELAAAQGGGGGGARWVCPTHAHHPRPHWHSRSPEGSAASSRPRAAVDSAAVHDAQHHQWPDATTAALLPNRRCHANRSTIVLPPTDRSGAPNPRPPPPPSHRRTHPPTARPPSQAVPPPQRHQPPLHGTEARLHPRQHRLILRHGGADNPVAVALGRHARSSALEAVSLSARRVSSRTSAAHAVASSVGTGAAPGTPGSAAAAAAAAAPPAAPPAAAGVK
ncbi:LOW QUALITY PROTEIN: hypothetical protein BU14_1341s0004 [Porphyra umbilicalis]|uniref:Uncharacterized protein n=1 Tax=Porphyra umbilicalis TaxID=2786 RepID=A0A1X6NMB7_PORUM|nr:LOW QUALITY PROTEIN: hypothetical protein BU14_1341s0004 [Porphyra umbilicalis]|eukprot:OSX69616.1 LOW QUALITY PROTEIN: hypothetical protein BU14_1341s0004 [Porphyra umbilicalis]